jgi:hypothetical protein
MFKLIWMWDVTNKGYILFLAKTLTHLSRIALFSTTHVQLLFQGKKFPLFKSEYVH